MNVLYLTNNDQLASTARILTSWLKLGRADGVEGAVVVPREGELAAWLRDRQVLMTTSPMPWLSTARPVAALRETWRIARWARKSGVDLVHCNEHDVYPFGVIVARLLRAPIVCHVRFRLDRGFSQWAFGGWRRPDALLWTSNQQRQDSADAVCGIVPDERQHLIRLGPDPEIFRPPSIECRAAHREQLGIAPNEVAVGTATALRPVKRLEDFVDLIASLASRDPRIVGLIAGAEVRGDEAYRSEIERRLAATGLGRRLRWLGHVEPIAPFLQSLDVFLSTSEYETFGNSVCEAMACGLPIAAYVGGSVHEVLGDTGAVVPNRDAAALLAAVDLYVSDAGLRERAARAGASRVMEMFNPAMSFRRLQSVYGQVCKGRAMAPSPA